MKIEDEKMTDEKMTDEKMTDEKMTDEKMTDEKMTDEKMTDEKMTDEKMTDEKMTDESMDRKDIIANYIEHIRNISELSDGDIESTLDEAIEKDEELLDVLEKFLVKRKNIREKSVQIDIICSCDDEIPEEACDILDIFEEIEFAYPLEDIIDELKDSGYADPETVVVDALKSMLYVDSIDKDGEIYLALNEKGEKLWERHSRDEDIEEETKDVRKEERKEETKEE